MSSPPADAAAQLPRTGPRTRFECRVCWTVYDPELGDDAWQIPPGTPFADLPPYWTCPNCSCVKQDFLALE
jgi:rubredoxin